jgi:hypothetical protein
MSIANAAIDEWPLPQRISDYLFSMECLRKRDAKRMWRKAIKDAWNNCCAYCGNPPIDDSSLTIDHVRPRSRGGEDLARNCAPCCLGCNQSKASNDWLEWYRDQSFYTPEREARIRNWMESGMMQLLAELRDSEVD